MLGPRTNRTLRDFSLAVFLVGIAFVVRLLLDPLLGRHEAFQIFYLPVVVVAWLAGLWPALFTLALGFGLGDWFFSDPRSSFLIVAPDHQFAVFLYVAVGTALAALGHLVRHNRRRLELAHVELKQRVDELKMLLEILPVGVWTGDAAGREIRGNPAAYQILGLREGINASRTAAKSELPEGIRMHVNGIEVAAEDLPIQRVARTGKPWHNFEHDLTFPDGTVRAVYGSAVPLFDDQGRVRKVIAAYADFTERRKSGEALRVSEERLKLAMQAGNLGAWEVDLDTGISTWDERIPGLLGLGSATPRAENNRWLEMVHADDRVRVAAAYEAVVAGGAARFSEDFRVRLANGSIRWFALRGTVIARTGQPRRMIGVAQDITERKHTEEQLEDVVAERTAQLQEKIEELQHVSYAIAHDMRAPLRAMGAFAQLVLDEQPGLSVESRGYCSRILSAARRLDELIADALAYTKVVLQQPTLEPVKLSTLLHDLVVTYPNLHPDKADVHIEELPVVLGNEPLLTQCFSNLLGNAVKFVAPGTRPNIRVWSETDDSMARVWVEDNGIGIPKPAQARLFGMFQKLDSRYDGTGIGLAIVRKVVERMGGRVGVESEANCGSRFWVALQLAPLCRVVVAAANGSAANFIGAAAKLTR